VYTDKSKGRTGYEAEKWHWSYMPVSSVMLDAFNELVSTEDISGFDGSAVADSIQIIDQFVNGIAK
jgi:LAS superfamily LD-carboxypeptidase LdcB